MISRFDSTKGVHVFIETAALIMKKYKNIYFIHIGYDAYFSNSQYYSVCKKLVHNLDLEKHFFFLNYEDDLSSYYPLFFATVLPSTRETLGYVILESQFYKKPVIASNVGGVREAMACKELLIEPPASSIMISEKLQKLLNDHLFYSRCQEVSYAYVEKNFNLTKNVKKLEKLYLGYFD